MQEPTETPTERVVMPTPEERRAKQDAERRAALVECVRVMKWWAQEGDGVHPEAWGAYRDAHEVLGLPPPKSSPDLGPDEALYGCVEGMRAWAIDEGGFPEETFPAYQEAHRALGYEVPSKETDILDEPHAPEPRIYASIPRPDTDEVADAPSFPRGAFGAVLQFALWLILATVLVALVFAAGQHDTKAHAIEWAFTRALVAVVVAIAMRAFWESVSD